MKADKTWGEGSYKMNRSRKIFKLIVDSSLWRWFTRSCKGEAVAEAEVVARLLLEKGRFLGRPSYILEIVAKICLLY